MRSRRRLLIPLTIILILVVAATMGVTSSSFTDLEGSTNNVSRVISNWYDLAWGYRKPITINNSSGGPVTDYQVKVTIDTATLIGDEKMQSDGDDIRFTRSDGSTGIYYWIQSGIDTDSTIIWVQVPNISMGGSTVYMYYGNSGASAASSLSNTFSSGSFEDLFSDDSKIDWSTSEDMLVSAGQAQLDIDAALAETEGQVQLQGGVNQSISGTTWCAQSITVGFTGILSRITLKVLKSGTPTSPFVVELRNAVGDKPGSTLYASMSKNPSEIDTVFTEKNFVLGTRVGITAGEKYVLVFKTSVGSTYGVQYITSDVYSNGAKSMSWNSGGTWTTSAEDVYLKTYVNTLWRCDQSQTGISGTRQVYGNNWWAQSFQAGLSGQLEQISLGMAKQGNPPAAVTVEVRNTEQVVGEILDQSQTSYSGSKAVYGNTWEGQTFRAGSDGDMTKAVLRASKTGNPGSLTVELRNVVTGYQDTLDQSQAAYSGARSVYAGNWAGQVFQAGLNGDLGKIILWASKTGSPTNPLTMELRNAVQVDEEYLDQSQTASGPTMAIYSDDMMAQTFTAEMSGTLTSLSLMVKKSGSPPNPLVVEIRNATGDDLPGTTVYATASRSDISSNLSEHVFTFSSPASLVAGVKYSMVVYTIGGASKNSYAVAYNTSDTYSGGRRACSWWGGVWDGQSDDMYFKTFVTVPAYLPGSTVYTTASRSDIGAAGEYEFTLGSPYAVTAGTRYAIVIYTSGGSNANRYNMGYQGSDVYSNGRECYSSNSGTNWTGSASDLYFKTYTVTAVGDEPGNIVYAMATRSDITGAGEYTFTFASPYAVTAASNYALVVRASGGDAANYYSISYQASNAYLLGKEAGSSDGGSNWVPNSSADLYFKTYIYVATGYRPGSTVYASATRSIFVNTTEKVEFIFNTSFSFVSGNRYTIVVKTTGGDASNNYVVSYQVSNVYAGGNESYTTNAGSNWSITSNDLWFSIFVNQPATGVLRSVTIPIENAARFAVGIQLSWNDTEQTNSDIKYQMEYYTGSAWSIIPDGDLPGNSAGFDGSPVDISSVFNGYDQVRIRADLYTADGLSVPGIQDWTVTYYYREYTLPEPGMIGMAGEE